MKPVLKYRGGKSREIPRFAQYIPSDFKRYIEPFFGGGAVYFYLEPQQAIINDINPRLMTFYEQLRNNYPLMRKQLDALQLIYESNHSDYERLKSKTPTLRMPNANEDLYYRMRAIFNQHAEPLRNVTDSNHNEHNTSDMVYLDGVLYYYINKTAYSGMIRYNHLGEYNVPFGRYKHLNTQLVTYEHSQLLQRADLYNVDYKQVFDMADTDDFIFLDPPYDCTFNDYGNLNMHNGFDEAEHRRVAQDFKNLSCRALMIIGKTTLISSLYRDFIVDEYDKSYAVNIRNRFKHNSTHLIIKNY